MRRIILLAGLGVLVVIICIVVLLGAFPPQVTPQPVQHTLPNDRFQSH